MPETSDKYVFDNKDAMARLSSILSMTVMMSDPKPVYDYILKSVAELFHMTELTLKIQTVGSARFAISTVYGFDPVLSVKILDYKYPEDWPEQEMQKGIRISKNGYLIDGVKWAPFAKEHPQYDIEEMYDKPDRMLRDRTHPGEWHEADFFEFVIRDEKNTVIGYLEVGDGAFPEELPPKDLVEAMDIFSQVIGIVHRIWQQVQVDKRKRENASILAMLIGRDLNKLLTEAETAQSRLRAATKDNKQMEKYVNITLQNVERALNMLASVGRVLDSENRPYSLLTIDGIDRVLMRWKNKIAKERKDLDIDLTKERGTYLAKIDNRFDDLIYSCLELIESGSDKNIGHLSIDLSIMDEGGPWVRIELSCPEIDDRLVRNLNLMMRAPIPTHAGIRGNSLSMFLVRRILSDYGGQFDIERGSDGGYIRLLIPAKQ